MKTVLYVTHASLTNPTRGTPIRMRHIALELAHSHRLILCAQDIDVSGNFTFIKYPSQLQGLKKIRFFRDLVRKEKIDVVVTSTETNIKLPVLLKYFTGVKIVIDLHGIHAEERYFAGAIRWWSKILYGLFVRTMLAQYDLILPVSKRLGDYYRIWNKQYIVAYGGVDEKEFSPESYKAPDVFTVGYMGNPRVYQGLEYLVEALGKLKEASITFRLLLIVSGKEDDATKELLEKNHLTDLTELHRNVPHHLVNDIIKQSSVLVIPRPSVIMTEYAYPSKLPEYLMTGVPTLVTEVGPVKELSELVTCKPYYMIPAKNIAEHLFMALKELSVMSSAERKKISDCGVSLVRKHLLWKHVGDTISAALEKL